MDSVMGIQLCKTLVLFSEMDLVLGVYIYIYLSTFQGFRWAIHIPPNGKVVKIIDSKRWEPGGTFLDIPSWSVITVEFSKIVMERYGKTYVVVKCAAKIRRFEKKKLCLMNP